LPAPIWVALCALTAAVSAGMPRGTPSDAAPPPPTHRITDVPLVEPNTNWCGPAALAAVLQYHGEAITAQDVAERIYLPDYRGSLNLDLLVHARERNFEAWAAAGSPDMLSRAIRRDRPVICMLRKRGPLARRNHYVVVRGYDVDRALWFIDGGDGKEVSCSTRRFEREWEGCGRWMLVVEGKTEQPPVGG
jgi:ABC-type bacteriocin/lantibiotic exporter with double-glycine peptidase domain